MKSLMLLWENVAKELATWCNTSAAMDIKTVHSRVKYEGLSFLTITLPSFGKDTQKCLDRQKVDRSSFQGFSWKAGLPKFLSGFLGLVFDRSTGVLLDDPSDDAIFAVRQLTLMYQKILLPCTAERQRKAFDGFIQCEQDVRSSWKALDLPVREEYQRVSSHLFGVIFTRMDFAIRAGRIMPKHGPGNVAERYSSNEKYYRTTWTRRLEEVFPSGDFLIPNDRFWRSLVETDILEPGSEIPVRVTAVPKTLKTPRIIGIEPAAMQYAQQGLLASYRESLRKDAVLARMIGIDDQEPNQFMAQKGARDGSLATLDLSEASDRVSNQHVRLLFRDHSSLRTAIDATRSRKADVPGHGVIRLAKFASMGSAVCFPVESSVFLTLVFMGISRWLNTPVSRSMIEQYSDKVRVFGDDIIVPVDCVEHVIRVLEAFGLKVNRDKSFWTGKFRESCGKEYYGSRDVSIARVRRLFPHNARDAYGTISIVVLRNQLYQLGLWNTVRWLDGEIERRIIHFPNVLPTSAVLGRHSFLGYATQRMDPHLHAPLVKGYVVKSQSPVDKLDDFGALTKFLIKQGVDPLSDGHLERSGRPQAVYTKLRWCQPF